MVRNRNSGARCGTELQMVQSARCDSRWCGVRGAQSAIPVRGAEPSSRWCGVRGAECAVRLAGAGAHYWAEHAEVYPLRCPNLFNFSSVLVRVNMQSNVLCLEMA